MSDDDSGREVPAEAVPTPPVGPPCPVCGRELGLRPLVAHCHLGLGQLYRRTGKREQAQEHLTTATTMYHEMGTTYSLEKAQVELQALA